MSRKRPAPRTGSAIQPQLWAGATNDPTGSAGPCCPVQPGRDVRVKRAQRGQITWGGSTSTPRCPPITRCVLRRMVQERFAREAALPKATVLVG